MPTLDKMAAISQTTFYNAFLMLRFALLNIVRNGSVEINQYWFR